MPTYSYACTECGNRFDEVQAFSDDALTSCPQCNGRLRKLFGNGRSGVQGQRFLPHRQPRARQELERLHQQLGVDELELVFVGQVQLQLIQRFELDHLGTRRRGLQLTPAKLSTDRS